MPQTGEARSWWADVEHVRETIERRREAEERATAARAERHLSVVADHRASSAHGIERRAADRHAGDRHTAGRRTADRHAGERHASERHAGDRHAVDRHAADRHTGERRTGERRVVGPRTAELRAVERRAGERRAGDRRRGTVGASPGERRGRHRAEPRRTVEITGRTVPAPAVLRSSGDPTVAYGARGSSRRPSLSPADRLVHRPDRIAMWAVVLGFVLILVAATSA